MDLDVKHWILLIAAGVLAVLALIAGGSYVGAREDRIKLQATMDAEKKIQAHLDADQKQRDADLQDRLAALEKSKQDVAKMPPAQQVQAITKVIPLPFPMHVETQADPITGKLEEPKITMPVANLKPLYDFSADCQECKDKLQKASADLEAEKAREKSITNERDSAVKAAKGTFWRHVSESKWLKLVIFAGGVYAGKKL